MDRELLGQGGWIYQCLFWITEYSATMLLPCCHPCCCADRYLGSMSSHNTTTRATNHIKTGHHITAMERLKAHSLKNLVWASQWLVTLCTFYRQILSLAYRFFLWNFRPWLARLFLVYRTLKRKKDFRELPIWDFDLCLCMPGAKYPKIR